MNYLKSLQTAVKSYRLFTSFCLCCLLLTACNDGSSSASNINVSVNLGDDFNVNSGEIIELNVQANTADNSSITYQWIQRSGIPVSFDGQNQQTIKFTAPDVSTANDSLIFEVIVTDNQGVSNSDTVVITILASDTSSSTVRISWKAPAFNENGSELTNLSGFKIYYGQSADKLDKEVIIHDPKLTFFKIDRLSTDALYYFSMTAFNDFGFESQHSDIVQIQP